MLTKRQADCLEFLARWQSAHRESPSFTEMMEGLNIASKSSMHRLLVSLEERGYIRRLKNRVRAIELLRQPDDEAAALARDAARYRWLRERNLDTIHHGGVFAGMTPENVVLNQEDLDRAVDSAMAAETLVRVACHG